ncbi:hypothetical protein CLF_103776 [Clonorchis sinensis]|uniref:Uncharacterized protein n=1 Tax=Clonorchis sinensis TaxID=79923 RepID=G7YAD1_CLOSI|nr:hypothetical protein CLF_103776 [Clonorchis sinensis]
MCEISVLKREKAPGPEDIYPVLFKEGEKSLVTHLIRAIWNEEKVPAESAMSTVIFKKDVRTLRENHDGTMTSKLQPLYAVITTDTNDDDYDYYCCHAIRREHEGKIKVIWNNLSYPNPHKPYGWNDKPHRPSELSKFKPNQRFDCKYPREERPRWAIHVNDQMSSFVGMCHKRLAAQESHPGCAIDNNLYVDDCLKSLPDSATAKCFVDAIGDLLSKGAFRIRSWSSNDRRVLSATDPTELTSGVNNLTTDPLPVQRALGVQWATESDTLVIVLNLPMEPPTRRDVPSCISSLYDPLGFVSPWLIPGKCLLQSPCKGELGSDEPLNDTDRTRWDNWLSNLRSLHNLRFPSNIIYFTTQRIVNKAANVADVNSAVIGRPRSCLGPVEVRQTEPNGTVVTHALLDNCFNTTLLTADVTKQLKIEGEATRLEISPVNGHDIKDTMTVGFAIQSMLDEHVVDFDCSYTIGSLPIIKASIPNDLLLSEWTHLADVKPARIPGSVARFRWGLISQMPMNCVITKLSVKDYILRVFESDFNKSRGTDKSLSTENKEIMEDTEQSVNLLNGYHQPGNVPIVFYYVAKIQDVLLNDSLFSKLELTNEITGVVPRFRLYKITLSGGIDVLTSTPTTEDMAAFSLLWKKWLQSEHIPRHAPVWNHFFTIWRCFCSVWLLMTIEVFSMKVQFLQQKKTFAQMIVLYHRNLPIKPKTNL